jgi:hypothetical protein
MILKFLIFLKLIFENPRPRKKTLIFFMISSIFPKILFLKGEKEKYFCLFTKMLTYCNEGVNHEK